MASALAMAGVYGLADDYFGTYRERIAAVTPADVLRAARTHLHPDAVQILAVGDAGAIEGPLAAMQLGPLAVTNADDDEGAGT